MNHKRLLSTTALVGAGMLFATGASAQDLEVSLSGYTEFLAEHGTNGTADGDDDRGYYFTHDTEIHVRAEGTTDTGITYGSIVELEAGGVPMFADEMNLYFSGAFGRIELGRQDGPVDTMVLDPTIIAAGTAGVDGDTDNQTTAGNLLLGGNTGDATKVMYYTPRVAGFQLGVGFTPDTGDGQTAAVTGDNSGDFENVVEGGANWEGEFGGLDTGLFAAGMWGDHEDGTAVAAADGEEVFAWGGGGLIGFAGLDFAASYGFNEFGDDSELSFFLVGVGFGFGPFNTSVHWEHDMIDGDDDTSIAGGVSNDGANIYVVSADMGLMPGVVLKGDVSYNDDDPGTLTGDDDSIASVVAIQLSY